MKVLKLLGIGLLAAALVLGVLAALSAYIYVTPENVMQSLQASISMHLQREITCSAVEVQPLSGITLRDVVIQHRAQTGGDPLLRCSEVRLTHSLLPLFIKKLLIRDIVVVDPVFSPEAAGATPRAYHTLPDLTPPLHVVALPRSIRISGGRVLLTTAGGPLSIEDLQLSARRISLIAASPITLSARIAGDSQAEITGTGTLSVPGRSLKAELSCSQVSLARFHNQLAEAGLQVNAGLASLHATVEAGLAEARIQAQLELSGGALSIPAASAASDSAAAAVLENLDASCNIAAVWDITNRSCEINTITGKLLSAPFSGNGSIKNTGRSTYIKCMLHMPKLHLDELFSRCVQLPAAIPRELRIDGPLGVRMNIAGRLGTNLFPAFLFQFRENKVVYPPLGHLQPRLSGNVSLDSKRISLEKLKIGTEDLWVSLAGDLSGYQSWPPKSSVRIVSSRINFANLFTPAQSGGISEELGPFDLKTLAFKGPINLGTTLFLGLRLKHVRGSYRLANNIFEIADLTGSIERGTFKTDMTVDLGVRGLVYHAQLDLEDIPLREALQLLPLKSTKYMTGNVFGTCSLAGSGTDPVVFLQNLQGRADITIREADMRLLDLLPQIASFVDRNAVRHVVFDTADMQFVLQSGSVQLYGTFISPDIKMYPEGTISLDGTLDLVTKLHIAPKIFADGTALARYMPQEDGMVALPVTIRGPLAEPEISITRETLDYIIKDSLPRLLMDLLKSAGEAGAQETPEGTAETDPEAKNADEEEAPEPNYEDEEE